MYELFNYDSKLCLFNTGNAKELKCADGICQSVGNQKNNLQIRLNLNNDKKKSQNIYPPF